MTFTPVLWVHLAGIKDARSESAAAGVQCRGSGHCWVLLPHEVLADQRDHAVPRRAISSLKAFCTAIITPFLHYCQAKNVFFFLLGWTDWEPSRWDGGGMGSRWRLMPAKKWTKNGSSLQGPPRRKRPRRLDPRR